MPKCQECHQSFGLLQLSGGRCKDCINRETPPCKECQKNFSPDELTEGYCPECYPVVQKTREARKAERELTHRRQMEEVKKEEAFNSIVLTTESVATFEIEKRLEIITAECVYGMNVFRDLFAGVRDVVGGRSSATQKVLKDAKNIVLKDLRQQAFDLGANAVVAIDLNYSEFSGGGKAMLFVVATGTAVKAKFNVRERFDGEC